MTVSLIIRSDFCASRGESMLKQLHIEVAFLIFFCVSLHIAYSSNWDVFATFFSSCNISQTERNEGIFFNQGKQCFSNLHFHYTLLQIPCQKFHKMHLYKNLNELMQSYAQNFPSTVDLFWI